MGFWSYVYLESSENKAVGSQHLSDLNQTLTQQDVEEAIHLDRRVPKLGSLAICFMA